VFYGFGGEQVLEGHLDLACTNSFEKLHLESLQKSASYKRELIQQEDCSIHYMSAVLGRCKDHLSCAMELSIVDGYVARVQQEGSKACHQGSEGMDLVKGLMGKLDEDVFLEVMYVARLI
jgi:hypothetical protein